MKTNDLYSIQLLVLHGNTTNPLNEDKYLYCIHLLVLHGNTTNPLNEDI